MSNNDWGFERMAQPSRPQEDVRNMPYTTPVTPQPTKVLRDDRLERIALEYLRILLPAHLNGVRLECSIAEAAVRNAKALIAELDKQA